MRTFDRLTRAERVKVIVAVVLIVLFVGLPVFAAATHGTRRAGFSLFDWALSSVGPGKTTTLDDAISEQDSFAADQVRNLDVSWHGGSVTVERGTSDELVVREEVAAGTYEMDPTHASFALRGDTLVVDDGLPDTDDGRDLPDMRLTISLPQTDGWTLGRVELSGTAARTSVAGLTCDTLSLSTVSAPVELTGIAADSVKLSDVSGSYTLGASKVGKLQADTVSGSQALTFDDAVPSSISVQSVSGDTTLTLPEGTGLTLKVPEVLGPDLHLRDGVTQRDGTTYTSGDGALDITLDTVSGSFTLA